MQTPRRGCKHSTGASAGALCPCCLGRGQNGWLRLKDELIGHSKADESGHGYGEETRRGGWAREGTRGRVSDFESTSERDLYKLRRLHATAVG